LREGRETEQPREGQSSGQTGSLKTKEEKNHWTNQTTFVFFLIYHLSLWRHPDNFCHPDREGAAGIGKDSSVKTDRALQAWVAIHKYKTSF
jgi:hypothetical protein